MGGLCELCLKEGIYTPADIVHHKVYINPTNIDNPDITLNWKNLQAVCITHHNQIHNRTVQRRYTVDEFGHVIFNELWYDRPAVWSQEQSRETVSDTWIFLSLAPRVFGSSSANFCYIIKCPDTVTDNYHPWWSAYLIHSPLFKNNMGLLKDRVPYPFLDKCESDIPL